MLYPAQLASFCNCGREALQLRPEDLHKVWPESEGKASLVGVSHGDFLSAGVQDLVAE